ncbi:MAG TPA: hypothetical protein VIR29_00390, partial [Anseongella sp.]
MMKTCLYPILLLLTGFLAACDKKEELPVYPVKMTFDRIEPTSEMRVFTSGGTKLDNRSNVAAITGFLDRYYVIGTTSYNSRFTEPGESYGKANFTFYGDGRIAYSAVTEITDVTRIDDVMLLQAPFTNKVEDDPLATSNFFKYPFNPTQDGRRYYIHYVIRSDEQSKLEVPLLYYKLVRYNENGKLTSVDFGTVRNELNEAFIKTLGKNDTLA